MLLSELEGLSVTAKNCLLMEFGDQDCDWLAKISRTELLKVHGLGRRRVYQIMDALNLYKNPVVPELKEIQDVQDFIDEKKLEWRRESAVLAARLQYLKTKGGLEKWNAENPGLHAEMGEEGLLHLDGRFSCKELINVIRTVQWDIF